MPQVAIRPQRHHQPLAITQDYSLEITARDVASLRAAAPGITPGTAISVTFLPGETMADRVEAARVVRTLGFEPMPHFSARWFTSQDDFEGYLARLVDVAGVRRCFVVAGDPPVPAGPYEDSNALIVSGAFERAGIEVLGVGGYPEGHPHLSADAGWRILADKCDAIAARGMDPLIVTQFGFAPEPYLDWLKELRHRGIDTPVRIGIPGPAGIKTLLRFAARCGVGASAAVLAKYGVSVTRLLGTAGPDTLVTALTNGLGAEHGRVRLHLYPFGGLEKTVEWIDRQTLRP